ncbi:MAG: PaaI family thioesterase [Pseudomonadota bacterium]
MSPAIPIANPFSDVPGFECFACGAGHPHGLQLKLQKVDDQVFCRFNARKEFSGFSNILHGGIQATILDEVMWWGAFESRGLLCLSQSMEIEYRAPIHIGSDIVAMARVTNEGENTVDLVGELRIGEEIYAKADGRYFFPSARLLARVLDVPTEELHPKLRSFVCK